MRLKYFLRGLGIGMVVAAFVLFVAFKTNPQKMTNDEIKKAAKDFGMVDATTESLFNDENTSNIEATEDTTRVQATEAVTTEAVTTEEVTTEEVTTEKITTEEVTTQEAATQSNNTYVISITQGMYSDAVASKLFEMGLVDDAVAFDSYLNTNGYADRLLVGEHTITQGATYEQIAKALISK